MKHKTQEQSNNYETKKNNNDVKINNYIDDSKDKTNQNKYNNNNIKQPKTNGKLKVEYEDNKNEDEEEKKIEKNKKKLDDILIDYENIIPNLQTITTQNNNQYTSAQLESIRYIRESLNNLEKNVATLTENDRQKSSNEIGDRKAEAKKEREEEHNKNIDEYTKNQKIWKKKFKNINDSNELFAKGYMEQFLITSAIDKDEEGNLCIKPMVHTMGEMFKTLSDKKEQYVQQAKKDDTYEAVNQNIINILNRIDAEMGYGAEFSNTRKEMRLFARNINDHTKDTSILSISQMGFFPFVADVLKRFLSIILSPIWSISYDNSYKLMAKYNKDLLEVMESMNSNDFSKISRPKCIKLYRKILELEHETLFLPVSRKKYLDPLKKFLRNIVMENGDRNEDGCELIIETCGIGNFINSISKKVSGDNEKVKTLMKRYLFENENSIFNGITCTDELLGLLKKFDGKDINKLAEYFHDKFAGQKIKLNNNYINIPKKNIDRENKNYKDYKTQLGGLLTKIYKGTILSSSEDVLMGAFKTKMTEENGKSSYKEYINLRQYIHTMNGIYDDDIDRLNKLDSVYISTVVPIAKRIIEYTKQENIAETKSFGALTLMKAKIEKLKEDYVNKKEEIKEKKKKQLLKNLDSFRSLRKQLKGLIDNKKALKDSITRDYYQAQLKKIEKYIIKQYGESAFEETEDKDRLKEIGQEIQQHIEGKYKNDEQPNTSMYDEAIQDITKMIREVNNYQQAQEPNKSLKDIDNMFNERAKNNLEVFSKMKSMMGGRGGGFGGGFGDQ